MSSLGIMFKCVHPPEALIGFVQQAEALGLDEVWIVEDCFFAGGIASVATALAVTERIQVGLGIMPAVLRNPALVAMEIAALSRLHPQRFLPGLGHGVGEWMMQIGAFPPSQLTALREVTTVVRQLLRGEEVNFEGKYAQMSRVKLEFPPTHIPPVSLGVRGQKSLQLSGEVADGTILAEHASPAYVRWAREQIALGQRQPNAPHRLTVYMYLAVAENRQTALQTLRPILAGSLASGNLGAYLKPLGIEDEVKALMSTGGQAHLEKNMPDEWIMQMAIAGTPDDCRAAIQNLTEAGADSVVLVPMDANWEAFLRG